MNSDLERLYSSLKNLESALGSRRLLSECSGKKFWPKKGVYLFFEPGEFRSNSKENRIVRVGTHAVSSGSRATLWNRLRTHKGTANGCGNHRGSIFRTHVGAALACRDTSLAINTWGIGQSAQTEVREKEELLEQMVSAYIGSMSVLWLAVEDEAGPGSDRAYLERNLIGLLSDQSDSADKPSSSWLGHFSPNERIRGSGLWNLDHIGYAYSHDFLDLFDKYVAIASDNAEKEKSMAGANRRKTKLNSVGSTVPDSTSPVPLADRRTKMRTMKVQGTGRASEKPDMVTLSFSVEVKAKEYGDTLTKLNTQADDLRKSMSDSGLDITELKTTNFRVGIDTEYKGGKYLFVGYSAAHQMHIELPMDKALLNKVLQHIAQGHSGAEISLRFSVKDKETLRKKVLAEAVLAAKQNAETLASAAGVKLGKLLDINYGWAEVRIQEFDASLRCESLSTTRHSEADINPRDVISQDNVTLVYEITD